MRLARRTILIATCVAAVVVFAAVQDRVTASGARHYAAAQRAALSTGAAPVTIDQVVEPAVHRSVHIGLLSSGAVVLTGVLGSWFLAPGKNGSHE
jgi:hypothetical protein